MQRPMQNVDFEKKVFQEKSTPCCLGVVVQTILAKSKTLHKIDTFLILLLLLQVYALYYLMLRVIICCFWRGFRIGSRRNGFGGIQNGLKQDCQLKNACNFNNRLSESRAI